LLPLLAFAPSLQTTWSQTNEWGGKEHVSVWNLSSGLFWVETFLISYTVLC
jgi:hypothetical protein